MSKFGIYNQEAIDQPKVGDFWLERVYCPYFLVVAVKGEDITILNCIARDGEPNARVQNKDGTWQFDYSKSMVVTKEWLQSKVSYNSIPGFCADVRRMDSDNLCSTLVNEWRDYQAQSMRKKIEVLEAEFEEFTGWKYLKDGA